MRSRLVVFALCLFLIPIAILPASAKAEFYRVTPATRHQGAVVMVITTRRHAGTTLFTVLIQARHSYTLSPFHNAHVDDYGKSIKFDRWQTPNADPKTSREIISTSNRGGLHYHFSVPDSQLSSTLFTYQDAGYIVDHGKVRMMPSANFWWFRCRDFVHRRG